MSRISSVLDQLREALLPRVSNWRLLPYFLLLMVMFVLFPLAVLIARLIIRRARNRAARG